MIVMYPDKNLSATLPIIYVVSASISVPTRSSLRSKSVYSMAVGAPVSANVSEHAFDAGRELFPEYVNIQVKQCLGLTESRRPKLLDSWWPV